MTDEPLTPGTFVTSRHQTEISNDEVVQIGGRVVCWGDATRDERNAFRNAVVTFEVTRASWMK